MVPGGITETIWHFSGLLRLFDDIARDRTDLDEGDYKPQVDDYTAKLPSFLAPPVDDEFATFPVHMPDPVLLQDLKGERIAPVKHLHDPDHHTDAPKSLAPPPVSPPIPASGGGGGGGDFVIEATYQPGGEQSLVEIHQVNHLDNDTTLEVAPSPQLAAILAWETGNLLEQMEAKADLAVPDRWTIPQDTTQVTQFVDAHDQHEAASRGTHDPHAVIPGFYTNGVAQDPTLPPPDQLAVPQAPAAPNVTHSQGLGQWAYDGGNATTNLAQIVDLTDSARTMIVLGNSYTTNVIVQINSYVNHDHITVSDPAAAISVGGNEATNQADVVQHPGVYASLPSFLAGPSWNVDVVNGNYYNVHTLDQINYLSNNNITVQQSSDTQYVVQGGGDQLENVAQVNDGGFDYDMVVVGGSSHNLNAVVQNNILLNNDVIKLSGEGTAPVQSVTTGHNQLTNLATIENYGGNDVQPVTAGQSNVANAIKGEVANPDPSDAAAVAGDGGTFNVLYVSGDYYDINTVKQTNIVANSNVVSQSVTPAAAPVAAFYGGGTETQAVSTGQDVLTNDAAIIHVGATKTDVKGEAYTDTIMIQANLVTNQSDHVKAESPHTLAPEVVAFVGAPDTPDVTSAHHHPSTSSHVHEDPLASLTH